MSHAPIVSREFNTSPVRPSVQPQGATKTRVAFAAGAFAAVWSQWTLQQTCVLSQFIAPDGGLPNVGPRAMAGLLDRTSNPDIAANGAEFAFVWQQAAVDAYFDGDIRLARFDAAGNVLSPGDVVLSVRASGADSAPRIAFNGTQYLVAWMRGYPTPNTIRAALVSATGTVLRAFDVASGATLKSSPAVAAVGGDFLVVWEDRRNATTDIYGARVSNTGAVLDVNGIAIARVQGNQSVPAVACGAGTCLVTWWDGRANAPYASRVSSAAGTVLDPSGIQLSGAGVLTSAPAVDFDGTQFVVAWADTRGGSEVVVAARLATTGALLDGSGIVAASGTTPNADVAIAWDGTQHLLLWNHGPYLDGAVSHRLTPTLAVKEAGLITISNPTAAVAEGHGHWGPDVTFDGENALVAWTATSAVVEATRVSRSGRILEPNGIAIGPVTSIAPSVSVVDGGFAVAWVSDPGAKQVSVALLQPDGGRRRADVVVATTAEIIQDVTLIGGPNFTLALFSVFPPLNDVAGINVLGRRVDFQGNLLEAAPFSVASDLNNQLATSGVVFGNQFLAGYSDWIGNSRAVGGALLSPRGTLLSAAGFTLTPPAGRQVTPRLAGGGDLALAVYDQDRDIYGTLLHADGGASVVGIQIAGGPAAQGLPAAAWDGAQFLAVWTEVTNGYSQLFAREVMPDGSTPRPAFAVTTTRSIESSPRITTMGAGRFLVAYESFDPLTSANQIGLRFVTLQPIVNGEPCLDAVECASGACQLERCTEVGVDGGSGLPDAGPPNEGSADAGAPDGGVQPDGGASKSARRSLVVGCGCNQNAEAANFFGFLLLLGARLRGRQRPRSGRGEPAERAATRGEPQ